MTLQYRVVNWCQPFRYCLCRNIQFFSYFLDSLLFCAVCRTVSSQLNVARLIERHDYADLTSLALYNLSLSKSRLIQYIAALYNSAWRLNRWKLFLLFTFPARWNRKLGRAEGHLVQLSWVGSGTVIITTTQLNSTGHTAKCSESQNLWQLDQLSWDESRVVITAPDRAQLNQLSWVESGRALWSGFNRVVSTWNSVPNYVVSDSNDTLNCLKHRVDK